MKKKSPSNAILVAWSRIPREIGSTIRGLNENELNLRGGSDGWSIRETVHHLVEANLLASNMVIAALATNGCNFDWTWMNPSREWMRRVGYDKAQVEPALKTLRALCRHISALVAGKPGSLGRTIKLNDAPGDPRYTITVEKILRQEVDHAHGHLDEIRSIRKLRSR